MFITIPRWDVMEAQFGTDFEGDIVSDGTFYFDANDEEILPLDRRIEVCDIVDAVGAFIIKDTSFNKKYFREDFVNWCISIETANQSIYGTHRYLGVPTR